MLLTLPDELVIGIQEVDDQHRELYAQVNALHAAMREHDLPELNRVADYLVGYATNHFAMEERLMIEAGYPGFPEHMARHDEFARDLRRWRERLAGQGATAPLVVDMSRWLTSWLGEHIRKVDGKMAAFLRERAAKPSR